MSDREFDPFIEQIARELKSPVHFDARFDQRVMAALEPSVISIGMHRERRPWYRRSLSFSVTPLGALAAATLAGVITLGALRLSTGTDTQLAQTPDTALQFQPVASVRPAPGSSIQSRQFIIIAPEASSVYLVGDFNDWDTGATKMERVSADGAWSVTLPLTPGRYEYQFELDGALRITDPSMPQTASAFGSPNSVINVAARE